MLSRSFPKAKTPDIMHQPNYRLRRAVAGIIVGGLSILGVKDIVDSGLDILHSMHPATCTPIGRVAVTGGDVSHTVRANTELIPGEEAIGDTVESIRQTNITLIKKTGNVHVEENDPINLVFCGTTLETVAVREHVAANPIESTEGK